MISTETTQTKVALQPLRLEFRITLHEWLEFKWAQQSAFRLWLLRVADSSWIPLSVLLAASVVLLFLRISNVISFPFPAWLPLVLLVLLASCRIYSSLPSLKATRSARNQWKKEIANLDCTLELTESGFLYIAGPSTYQVSWPGVSSVFQSEHLFFFCYEDDEYVLLVPKRAFASKEQLKEFVDIAYQNTVLEIKADGPNLMSHETEPL